MFPGLPKWAENDTFTGGPDVGSDTKDAPSSGQEGEGYYRQYRPSAQVWNYNNWAALGLARNAAATRSLNYLKTNSTGPDASTGGGTFVRPVYDPLTREWFFLLNNGGATNADECGFFYVGKIGATIRNAWEVSNLTTPGANGRQPTDFAIDAVTGDRVYVANLVDRAWYASSGAFAAGGTQYAAAFGTTGGGVQTWQKLDHNWLSGANSRWVVAGVVAGTTTFWYAQTSTSALATVTVDPVFGVTSVREIRHSHHPANTNYYGDTGNSVWLALGTTLLATSVDGLTWTTAAAHSIPSPRGLAYSAYGSRWVTIESTAGNARVHYSDDNGSTWTAGQILSTAMGALTDVDIVSDGSGHFVASLYDSATPDNAFWVSVDNGITWTNPQLPDEFPLGTLGTVSCGYGGGRFWALSDDGSGIGGAPNYGLYSSLIGGDL